MNQSRNAEEDESVDGDAGSFVVPEAEQDAYLLNGTPVTMHGQTSTRVLHRRRVIDAEVIAAAQKSTCQWHAGTLRWECDFAVKHVYRGTAASPRTFAPKFGGLWLMRRKHWFEL